MVLKLKASIVPVLRTIVGGVYGYIVIILSPATYANIASIHPFIVPAPHRPLNVGKNATQFQIAHATALDHSQLLYVPTSRSYSFNKY